MNIISVIMPAFNAAQTIELSIRSVLEQTYSNLELIVVNDCSTDSTAEICERLAAEDSRIYVLRSPINGGVARARNLGLEACSGGYLAFLDSDDLWLPNKLSLQVESIFESNHFSYMTYEHMSRIGVFEKIVVPPEKVSYQDALGGNPIGTLTVLLSKELLANNRFPLRGHEDYALWLKLLRNIPAAIRSGGAKSYARYRRSSNSLSGSKLKTLRWQWEIYREQEHLSFAKSTGYMLKYGALGAVKHYL